MCVDSRYGIIDPGHRPVRRGGGIRDHPLEVFARNRNDVGESRHSRTRRILDPAQTVLNPVDAEQPPRPRHRQPSACCACRVLDTRESAQTGPRDAAADARQSAGRAEGHEPFGSFGRLKETGVDRATLYRIHEPILAEIRRVDETAPQEELRTSRVQTRGARAPPKEYRALLASGVSALARIDVACRPGMKISMPVCACARKGLRFYRGASRRLQLSLIPARGCACPRRLILPQPVIPAFLEAKAIAFPLQMLTPLLIPVYPHHDRCRPQYRSPARPAHQPDAITASIASTDPPAPVHNPDRIDLESTSAVTLTSRLALRERRR